MSEDKKPKEEKQVMYFTIVLIAAICVFWLCGI